MYKFTLSTCISIYIMVDYYFLICLGPQEFVSLFSLDYQLGSEDPGSQDYIYVAFKEELKQLQQSSSNCVTRNRQVPT